MEVINNEDKQFFQKLYPSILFYNYQTKISNQMFLYLNSTFLKQDGATVYLLLVSIDILNKVPLIDK